MKKPNSPTEAQEMAVLADYLDACGFLWCHVPNERKCSPRAGARLKRLGVKAGVPDVLIFDLPPHMDRRECAGIAIELKRERGGALSDAQRQWLEELRKRRWIAEVCHGAQEAFELLQKIAPWTRRRGVGKKYPPR
jgi:hypothetical protein